MPGRVSARQKPAICKQVKRRQSVRPQRQPVRTARACQYSCGHLPGERVQPSLRLYGAYRLPARLQRRVYDFLLSRQFLSAGQVGEVPGADRLYLRKQAAGPGIHRRQLQPPDRETDRPAGLSGDLCQHGPADRASGIFILLHNQTEDISALYTKGPRPEAAASSLGPLYHCVNLFLPPSGDDRQES